jgi:hypothetical protein
VPVGKAVDRTKFGATGDYGKVVEELTALSGPQLQNALEQLSGEIHASTLRLTQLDSQSTTSQIQDQLSDFEHSSDEKAAADKQAGRKTTRGGAPWFQIAGSHTSFKGDGSSPGTANGGGSGGGYDFKVSPALTMGGGASLSLGGMSLTEISGSSQITAPHVFGYSGYGFGPIHVHGGGSTAHIKTTTTRTINFAATVPDVNGNPTPLSDGIDRSATSDQTADLSDAWTEVQHTKKWDSWTADTKVGLRVTRLTRQPFSELGADSISLVSPELQLHTRDTNIDFHTWKRSGNYRPNILVSIHHASGDTGNYADLHFAGAPDSGFDTSGAQIPLNTFSGLFGLTVRSFSGLEYTLEYETRQSDQESTNAVHFRMRFR